MTIHTQLVSFKTSDNERLHGLLFTPPDKKSDLALIMVHGVAMNFYLPPLPALGQALAEGGHHCFVINTRGHDWIARAGNLTQFGGAAYETFEECLLDLDGAIDCMARHGYKRFLLVGHSLGCVKSLLGRASTRRYRRRHFLSETVLFRAGGRTTGVRRSYGQSGANDRARPMRQLPLGADQRRDGDLYRQDL
jgi:pimeloyl-ACP methyl ester carboxylesterase